MLARATRASAGRQEIAANEGLKDPLVLLINESLSLSLATSHSTHSAGFNISSCVSVSMVTMHFCLHSIHLQKREEIHSFHLFAVVETIFGVCSSSHEILFTDVGHLASQQLHQARPKVPLY